MRPWKVSKCCGHWSCRLAAATTQYRCLLSSAASLALINGTPDQSAPIRSFVRLNGDWHAPDDLWRDKRSASPAAAGPHSTERDWRRCRCRHCCRLERQGRICEGRAQACRSWPVFYCWWCCGCRHCCRRGRDVSLNVDVVVDLSSSSLFRRCDFVVP